jgi:hypothetical protein
VHCALAEADLATWNQELGDILDLLGLWLLESAVFIFLLVAGFRLHILDLLIVFSLVLYPLNEVQDKLLLIFLSEIKETRKFLVDGG